MAMAYLIAGVALGAFTSWYITHRYYRKSSREQEKLIEELKKDLKGVNTIKHFEVLLDGGKWKEEVIGGTEVWVSQEDNTFQIHTGDFIDFFKEPWATKYPDKSAGLYIVYLKSADVVIKELKFVSLDGNRIFVPMTRRDFRGMEIVYYWDMGSLDVKVCKVIGRYYIYGDLHGVAEHSNVEIRNNEPNRTI